MKKSIVVTISALLAVLFLFSCGVETKTPMTRESAEKLEKEVVESEIFSEEMTKFGNNSIKMIFGFCESAVWKTGYTGVSGAAADEFCIFEAPDESELEKYETQLKEYLADRLVQFRDYAPAQVPKLESAVIEKSGLFLIYYVGPESQKMRDLISKAI